MLSLDIYEALAAQFPVCLSSDEFHFFPQYRSDKIPWSRWDDFSNEAVRLYLATSAQWRRRLEKLRPPPSSETGVDVDLLTRVLATLEEQLRLVRPQETQPTFYLTIISIGLAEAMEHSYEALKQRINNLPAFVAMAMANLEQVPEVYRALGLEMIPKLLAWMALLPLTDPEQRLLHESLGNLQEHLQQLRCEVDYLLQDDIYARVAAQHIGCQMGLEEIGWHLEQEIESCEHQLAQAASRIAPGKSWQAVFNDLPAPEAGGNDAAALYQGGIRQLRGHILENGFVEPEVLRHCDVEIKIIPDHMTPIRANAAYSMPPGHPPAGGVFHILPLNRQSLPRDMMLLAAHETYPGHHLLDTIRWRLESPLRRCLEFPLFYEGWASFSEEILFDTEFFSGPVDRLLMAKRRLWRAHRGRADFRIHTGKSSLEQAAQELEGVGLVTGGQATAMVRRYALKPGYQLSYTMGRKQFRQLYTAFLGRGKTPARFVSAVLSHGEIGFDHLAEKLLY